MLIVITDGYYVINTILVTLFSARIQTPTMTMIVSMQPWSEGLFFSLMRSVTYLPMSLLFVNVLLQIVFSHENKH